MNTYKGLGGGESHGMFRQKHRDRVTIVSGPLG